MKREIIENEEARLNALRNLRLLDTPPSESFDRITRMASRLLGAPVSTISLTDRDRQWFKSRFGVDLAEIPRAEAPCNYAIHSDEVFVVSDMLQDGRFKESLLARAGIRFYAGAPLITRSGYGLGTLCVVDDKPRQMNEDEQRVLIDLAAMVMTQIELQNTIGRIDPTSGLSNEHQLFEDLEDLAKRSPGERKVGLLVELVSPRQISHGMRVLGAAYAEELIRNSTEIIRKAIGNRSRVYHVGLTRCVVVLDDQADRSWDVIANDLHRSLHDSIPCSGIPVSADPVVGAYGFQTNAVGPRDVLRRLFNAADDARTSGRVIASYNEIHDRAHTRSFRLLSDMREALERRGEFSLVYQPVMDFALGRYAGAEALLRWKHPSLGDVLPAEFIPPVEETAFTRPLTEWVLNEAVGQVAKWQRVRDVGKISINASARNLEESDFAERVAAILQRHGVPARSIQLEFTENAVLGDNPRVLEQLRALKRLGVSIAIDDFGTGYSALSYLQQFPANVLKIDRAFIKALRTSEHDQKLVRALIHMAHDLGYRVVAEGIEDREAYDLLAGWKCDEAQGFFVAAPMTIQAMEKWLAPTMVDG
jgi:EAL domain-containing protein (putative c-di-GMP-specific phosphodiesterase class I)/GGDEF domain-containing protein